MLKSKAYGVVNVPSSAEEGRTFDIECADYISKFNHIHEVEDI